MLFLVLIFLIDMLSKACQYGIKATILIAMYSEKNTHVSIKEIAKKIDAPFAFTAKIIQKLSKQGIVISVRGQDGGYIIKKSNLVKIKLIHLVRAIDGDFVYTDCMLVLKNCSEENPCPVHDQFKKIRLKLKQQLETTSLKSLIKGLNQGVSFLKI